jgi:uncharacterized membrane protein YgaE (UPF0421/DUF939 family)
MHFDNGQLFEFGVFFSLFSRLEKCLNKMITSLNKLSFLKQKKKPLNKLSNNTIHKQKKNNFSKMFWEKIVTTSLIFF